MKKDFKGGNHGLFGGTISALLVLTLCILVGLVFFGMAFLPGGGILFGYVAVLAAVAVGVVIALVQRWKEVEGGEEDEARKY